MPHFFIRSFFSCWFAQTVEACYFHTVQNHWTRHIPPHHYLRPLNDFNIALTQVAAGTTYLSQNSSRQPAWISIGARAVLSAYAPAMSLTRAQLLLLERSSELRSLWHHNTCHLSTSWQCSQSQRSSEVSRLLPPPFHRLEPRSWNLISAPLTMSARVS